MCVGTYATIEASLKSTTGSIVLPNLSLALEMLRVARVEAIVIQTVESAIWGPTHFLNSVIQH